MRERARARACICVREGESEEIWVKKYKKGANGGQRLHVPVIIMVAASINCVE